jgi:hypothetical protein
MSNNQTLRIDIQAIQKLKFFETLDKTTQNSLTFMLRNPSHTRVIYMEDPEGISDRLFSSVARIDATKGFLNNALNGIIKPTDPQKFFTKYPEYGIAFQELIDAIKKVENMGYDLASTLPVSSLRNKAIKREITKRKPKQEAAPKAKAEVKTPKEKETPKSDKKVETAPKAETKDAKVEAAPKATATPKASEVKKTETAATKASTTASEVKTEVKAATSTEKK